jgi:hypothetical protein
LYPTCGHSHGAAAAAASITLTMELSANAAPPDISMADSVSFTDECKSSRKSCKSTFETQVETGKPYLGA